jgi:NAD(P)-dependent dehydrogenase (short-subunit alcohol dehydrogenase family)
VKDLFSVEGKTVLVTGGSRGIGLMIARGFVEHGARVTIASRSEEACSEAVAELSKYGSCSAIVADLSTQQGCQALAAAQAETEAKLDVLVNNAGANWGSPIEEYPDAAWDKVMALNVKAIFHLTVACLPLLKKAAADNAPARVINTGSVDGLHAPDLETYAYSSSKAAVHHLTRTLAKRLARDRITVNAIAPGPFPSKMMKATLDEFGEAIISTVPLRRIGEPEDMAGVALYLGSRAGAYVTGTVIPVDGGMATTL